MCKWSLQKLIFSALLWCCCLNWSGALCAAESMFVPLAKHYEVKVVNRYPHNENSFTQGLLFNDGFLYESVGKRGKSALLKVELKTGEFVKRFKLDKRYFAEGLALLPASHKQAEKLVQVTYTANKGFVYDKHTFSLIGEFAIPASGWGLTTVNDELVMTDGSAELIFLDSKTFKVRRRVAVTDDNGPVEWLNELEFVDGFLLANVWQTSDIAVIDVSTGKVVSYIDLSPLLEQIGVKRRKINKGFNYDIPGALNGIAFDAERRRLFVTGKRWPWVFEITI